MGRNENCRLLCVKIADEKHSEESDTFHENHGISYQAIRIDCIMKCSIYKLSLETILNLT